MSDKILEDTDDLSKCYTIYIHKNKENNKVYIGQTSTSVNNRWQNGKGYKGCTLFERAINKYGWDGFEHIIVAENLTKEESCQMEKDLIKMYDSTNPQKGYNISIGGDSGHAGVKLSEETRRKISKKNKGKTVSQETREKMSLSSKGRKLSDLAYQKAIEYHSIEVIQLTKDGEFVNQYSSIAEASKQTGINVSTIESCVNKKRYKSAGGFIWVKASEYIDNCFDELFYKNDHLKPVIQLDKMGKYVDEFGSCVEAQIAIGKNNSHNINQCCRGEIKSAYGFIWVYKDQYDINKDYSYKKESYGNQYAVIQLSTDGKIIAEFNSVMEAHDATGINYSCICECCRGTQKTAGGFIWKKKDNIA